MRSSRVSSNSTPHARCSKAAAADRRRSLRLADADSALEGGLRGVGTIAYHLAHATDAASTGADLSADRRKLPSRGARAVPHAAARA